MPQPIEIEAPDGSIIEFPEGTSDETIRQVMARAYSGGGQSAPPPPPPSRPRSQQPEALAPIAPAAQGMAPPPTGGEVGPAGYTMEQLLATGMPQAEAEILFNGGTPDTYNGNPITYSGQQQPQESAPNIMPDGRRAVIEVSEPIMGGTRDQPIDVEALWRENPDAFNQMGDAFIGQYIRTPEGVARVRGMGTPTGDIGEPSAVGESGIRYYETDPNMERMGAFSTAAVEQIPFGRDYVAGMTGLITGEGYSAAQDDWDRAAAEQRILNPNLRNAGGFAGFGAGMVLTPGASYIGRGVTGAERALRAGQVGGAAGLVYGGGTGRGDAEERLSRALLTGAAGVGGGVAGQRVAEAIEQPLSRFSQQLADVLQPTQQRPAALGRGERRVEQVIQRGLSNDRVPLADALSRVDEGALPYELGDNLTSMAEAVRQSPGPGNPIVGQAVTDRVGGVSGRVQGEVAQAIGGSNKYFAEMRRLREARRTEARTGMDAIGQTEVPLSPEAVAAIRSPLASRAVRDEALNALSDLGEQASENAVRLLNLTDDAVARREPVRLTVREAQDISRSLGEAASRAYRGGYGSRGEALQAMADAIRGSARDQVPAYRTWLQRYADDSEVMQAFELGRNALGGGINNNAENIALQVSQLSDEGRGYFQEGIGEALQAMARSKGGAQAVRGVLRNEEFQGAIRLAFPDDAAYERFIGAMTREADIADRGGRIMAGPATAQRLATREMLEGQSIGPKVAEFATAAGAGGAVGGPAGAIGGGLGMLARELVKGLGQRGRQRANLLTNDETNRLLAEVLTNPDRFRDLLSRAQAREQIPGFSRRASDAIADVLQQRVVRPGAEFVGQRAGQLAGQLPDPFASPDRRQAQQ